MPPPHFDVRPVPYDAPDATAMIDALQAYYARIYPGPDPSPVDPREFAPPDGAFFVAYLDTDPVAMGGWRLIEPLPGIGAKRPAEIKRMYVETAARGHGYARRMLAHLEATASAAGADAIVLSTGPRQPEAIALYRSEGYVAIPKFGFFAAYEHAVHLGKRLDPPVDSAQHLEPAGDAVSARRAGGTAR